MQVGEGRENEEKYLVSELDLRKEKKENFGGGKNKDLKTTRKATGSVNERVKRISRVVEH